MARLLGGLLAAVAMFLGTAQKAEGAPGLAVCGSGYGHGVGLSQYGAKGLADAGQGYGRIVRTYYCGVGLKKYRGNLPEKVLLGARARGGAFDVVVRPGREVSFRNLATGDTVDLKPGRYRTMYLPDRKLYRVVAISRSRVIGAYGGPIVFRPTSGGPLRFRTTEYRGALLVRATNSRRHLVNCLPLEAYLRGVVPREMPASWAQQALKSPAGAARSYALATRRGGAFDFYGDVRDQVYGGFSAETAPSNQAVTGTARIYAAYDGRPITAFFHSANGRTTETAANVFGNPVPYLRSFRDVDGSGRAYEGWAHTRSLWMRWEGELDPDGSPQFGVGSIESIKVLDRAPSGRLEQIRVKGGDGQTTVSGQQGIRFGLESTGIQRNDGSSFPGGVLPSARAFFGGACD
jgi:stage II sporulation protein D